MIDPSSSEEDSEEERRADQPQPVPLLPPGRHPRSTPQHHPSPAPMGAHPAAQQHSQGQHGQHLADDHRGPPHPAHQSAGLEVPGAGTSLPR